MRRSAEARLERVEERASRLHGDKTRVNDALSVARRSRRHVTALLDVVLDERPVQSVRGRTTEPLQRRLRFHIVSMHGTVVADDKDAVCGQPPQPGVNPRQRPVV